MMLSSAKSYLMMTTILLRNCCNTADKTRSSSLTAISSNPHVVQLYREKGVPSETDEAISDPQVRDSICRTINDTSYSSFIFSLVKSDEILQNRFAHPDIFNQIFTRIPVTDDSSTTHYAYVYSNPFTERNFRVVQVVGQNANDGIVHRFRESVFMCVLRDMDSRIVRPIFVSKEYNVSPFEESYMPGRFIFWFSSRPHEYALTLAEEPAVVYEDIDPKFEVEKHYFRMRKYTEMAGSTEVDPLCELVPEQPNDLRNQSDRLCVAIAQSSYFSDWVHYPYRNYSECVEEEVSFRNRNNLELGKSYRERMISCHTTTIEYGVDVFFFISRAYMSNHVFVYERDTDGNMYLENMWTNVKIIDEINSFDFVEY